jgi:hypothetical protein
VPDVRVAIGLLGGGVVVVELTAEEVQPVLEEENAVVQVVRRAGLDEEDLLVGHVLGEAGSDNAASGTATDNDKVIAARLGAGDVRGSHVEDEYEVRVVGGEVVVALPGLKACLVTRVG